MNIAIVGAGFTGLSAAKKLLSNHHKVTLFEREDTIGGLAGTFKLSGWEWPIEKHYHHWFTNDTFALSLISDLGLGSQLVFPPSVTSVYYKGLIYPFNSPVDVLTFGPLSFPTRLRVGALVAYLKFLPASWAMSLERFSAYEWLAKYFGQRAFDVIWKPLLSGKFGPFAKTVNMTWLWARVKKRTPRLGYLEGGYHILLEALAHYVRKRGGTILLNTPFDGKWKEKFDATIITTPTPIFAKLFPQLPKEYMKRITSIPHLHALNLLLITHEKFLPSHYWLNINQPDFPFIGVIQHTNLMNCKHYGGNHLTWVANYLPPDHPYLKMDAKELFKVYLPYLKQINPSFKYQISNIKYQIFFGPFAQPVFPINYSKIKPDFVTPIKNVYLANMDMVYPWDRGTNYAIELGYKVAEVVEKASSYQRSASS